MAANYNNTTWFYECLSKLVFGQTQVKAQEYFLNHLKPDSSILIIGGGTGQLLESLSRLYPSGLRITYVEISAKMMALSRKRNMKQNEVIFITANIETVQFNSMFDAVITAFLFDNFSEAGLKGVFSLVNRQLKPDGLWINTDFQLTGPLWQKVMLKSMYLLFRVFGAVQVTELPDVGGVFDKYGYQLMREKTYYRDFIAARLYVKLHA